VSILVIDVGTSGLRAAAVGADGEVRNVTYRRLPPATPSPGLVEFDAAAMADAALQCAQAVLDANGPVEGVGITNQRASTVVWERATGRPLAPALGWQDLRTVLDCLTLAGEGLRLAPNQTATKARWLLDEVDPSRQRDLCVGTVDTWLVWVLTEGVHHVTDATNAAVTGLLAADASDWDDSVLEQLRIPRAALPSVVDSAGVVGPATALAGAPPVAGIAGDQQASLVGQGCVGPGQAKVTFGTGGMLDLCTGPARPEAAVRGPAGTFPIVAWSHGGTLAWGVEGIMLAAGSNVDWLVDDLGILESPGQSAAVAAACQDSGGVVYVPAVLGLGTPHWDFGARGTLLGLTRGSGRPEVVRAVLEGVAHRGADLVEAAEADTGLSVPTVRVDGGMSVNAVFVQALADATGRTVEVSPHTEATTVGAGYLAALGLGLLDDLSASAAAWHPRQVVAPAGAANRDRWREAVDRAKGWIPELSALDF
jgi:glycerol kinase